MFRIASASGGPGHAHQDKFLAFHSQSFHDIPARPGTSRRDTAGVERLVLTGTLFPDNARNKSANPAPRVHIRARPWQHVTHRIASVGFTGG